MISRRLFVGGLLMGASAPVVVSARNLMPIKMLEPWWIPAGVLRDHGFVHGRISSERPSLQQIPRLYGGQVINTQWRAGEVIAFVAARSAVGRSFFDHAGELR